MRSLTRKQKILLTKWSVEGDLMGWKDLSLEQMEELEQINDTEILIPNVNNFLRELRNL